MTGIWDEKPEKDKWVSFKYPVKSGEEIQCVVYDSAEMDVWLEKLKIEYDILKTASEVYKGIEDPVVIAKDKLDAIKEKAGKYEALEQLLTTSPQMEYDDVTALKYEVDKIIQGSVACQSPKVTGSIEK